jgi:Holliday junction resolvase
MSPIEPKITTRVATNNHNKRREINSKKGKDGERIIASLFRSLGFQVTFVGVEHRSHYHNYIGKKEAYSPDLLLYDNESKDKWYVEVKTMYKHNNSLIVDKENFDNYAKYYGKNGLLLVYLPEENKVGIRLINELEAYLSTKTGKSKQLKFQKSKKPKIKDKENKYSFDFDLFRKIPYYGKKHLLSSKFDIEPVKIDTFLSEHKDKYLSNSQRLS